MTEAARAPKSVQQSGAVEATTPVEIGRWDGVRRMVDWPGGKAMLVERLLPKAHERLVTIADDVPLIEAAKLLQTGTDLVIVCDSAGLLA